MGLLRKTTSQMGLRKTTSQIFRKNSQPTTPIITIHLDEPANKIFRPDDVVTGHVSLTTVQPIEPAALNVSFFGQSLIWHRIDRGGSDASDWHHYRDNAPLFEEVEDVLLTKRRAEGKKGVESLKPGPTYEFPFRFRFPASTSNSRLGQYENDADERYIAGPHPLPPSFLVTDKNGDGTDADYAKIEYGICASLNCPGAGTMRGKDLTDLTTTTILQFQPHPIANPSQSRIRHHEIFTLQSSILTGQDPDQIGFRQAIRDKFSSSTPRLAFEAALEIPAYLTPGTEFQFRATFAAFSQTENVQHIPAVTFSILKLDLIDITYYRAPRDTLAGNFRDGPHRRTAKSEPMLLPETKPFSISHTLQNMPPPDRRTCHHGDCADHHHKGKSEFQHCVDRKICINSRPEAQTVELLYNSSSNAAEQTVQDKDTHVWFTARVPTGITPSFRSFAVMRAYRVRVRLGVEVGGKRFDVEVESRVAGMG